MKIIFQGDLDKKLSKVQVVNVLKLNCCARFSIYLYFQALGESRS